MTPELAADGRCFSSAAAARRYVDAELAEALNELARAGHRWGARREAGTLDWTIFPLDETAARLKYPPDGDANARPPVTPDEFAYELYLSPELDRIILEHSNDDAISAPGHTTTVLGVTYGERYPLRSDIVRLMKRFPPNTWNTT